MNVSNVNTVKMPNKIFFCAISNISSGSCNEDCSFCTQSVKNGADIDRYIQKPIDTIVKEAKIARKNLAVGFCLVTAGKGITPKILDFVCKAAVAVKKEVPELNIIACNGLASVDDLKVLKEHGVGSYNHNLETSKEYYKTICTTHTWQERYQTCLNVKEVGLNLCTGGIFGMGESQKDRVDLVKSIKSLNPVSIAINFYHPNSALKIEKNISLDESLEIIKYIRSEIPDAKIMVAGGREITFKDRQSEIFSYGADSIVVGNYLTTSGENPNHDINMIRSLGLEIAKTCNG